MASQISFNIDYCYLYFRRDSLVHLNHQVEYKIKHHYKSLGR